MIKVWAIPLADKGFIPVNEWNPVRWYIERLDTGEAYYHHSGYATKADAEQAARNLGFEVEE